MINNDDMDLAQNKIFEIEKKFSKLTKKEYIETLINHQKISSFEKESDNIYKKKSKLKNAGNGIFAKRDFLSGEIICLYCPYLIFDKKNGQVITIDKDEKNLDEINKCYGDYVLNVYHDISIFANPNFEKNKDCLGHMCNDRGYSPYKRYNEDFNNGIFNYLYLIATKPIRKDDEIYISYGRNYWYNKLPSGKSRHLEIKLGLK